MKKTPLLPDSFDFKKPILLILFDCVQFTITNHLMKNPSHQFDYHPYSFKCYYFFSSLSQDQLIILSQFHLLKFHYMLYCSLSQMI